MQLGVQAHPGEDKCWKEGNTLSKPKVLESIQRAHWNKLDELINTPPFVFMIKVELWVQELEQCPDSRDGRGRAWTRLATCLISGIMGQEIGL